MLVFVLAISPFLGLSFDWLNRALLSFITLSKGPKAGLVTAFWCLPPAIALGLAIHIMILVYVGTIVLLAWLSSAALRYFKNAFPVIELMALVGCCIVLLFHMFMPDASQWWLQVLKQYGATLIQNMSMSPEEQVLLTAKFPDWSHYATGFHTTLLLLGTLLNLWIAQIWYVNINPSKKNQKRWRVSHITALLSLGVVSLVVLTGQPLLKDILPVLSFPLLVGGFYLVYTRARMMFPRYAGLFLAGVIIICVLQPHLLWLIVLAAWIDSWYDLVKGFHPGSPGSKNNSKKTF